MSNINIENLSYDSNMDSLAMGAMAGGRSFMNAIAGGMGSCTTMTRLKFPRFVRKFPFPTAYTPIG